MAWLLGVGHVEAAARMASTLGVFWQRHGHYSEGRAWLEQVLAYKTYLALPDDLRANTLQAAATLAYRQGDWLVSHRWLEDSLALFQSAGDRRGIARVLFDLGWIAIDQGEWCEATRLNPGESCAGPSCE